MLTTSKATKASKHTQETENFAVKTLKKESHI